MVRPMTNWRPRMRIACKSALRMTGSPERATSRPSTPPRSASLLSFSRSTRPVSISAQVEALTNQEWLWPRCRSHLAEPILSLISRSAVSASGMRNSASARHISTTPSSLDSSYSSMKASMPPSSRRRCADGLDQLAGAVGDAGREPRHRPRPLRPIGRPPSPRRRGRAQRWRPGAASDRAAANGRSSGGASSDHDGVARPARVSAQSRPSSRSSEAISGGGSSSASPWAASAGASAGSR